MADVEHVPTVEELDAILRGEPCPLCYPSEEGLVPEPARMERGVDEGSRRGGPFNPFAECDLHSEGL